MGNPHLVDKFDFTAAGSRFIAVAGERVVVAVNRTQYFLGDGRVPIGSWHFRRNRHAPRGQ